VNRFDGQVAFITGAARGQGRSHAVAFAQQGGDVIALDICDQIDTVGYAMATDADLEQTVREVEATGRHIVARKADVRSSDAVRKVVEEGVSQFGRLDVVVANAGIGAGPGMSWEKSDEAWQSDGGSQRVCGSDSTRDRRGARGVARTH
jgi:(+)-trans-carveol dehydrogenase